MKACWAWRPQVAIACAALAFAISATNAAASPCRQAAIHAEAAFNLPSGLLNAIGIVESGRADGLYGQRHAWPWAINASGQGRYLDIKEQAIAATRALLGAGVRNVDVGCFQINLMHHPNAFPDLEQAFDPVANGLYAARFLTELRGRLGSWPGAVAAYHSSEPMRGEAYRQKVYASWQPAGQSVQLAATISGASPWVSQNHGIRIWTPSPEGTAPSVVAVGRDALPRVFTRAE